jgi:hypothetical protein
MQLTFMVTNAKQFLCGFLMCFVKAGDTNSSVSRDHCLFLVMIVTLWSLGSVVKDSCVPLPLLFNFCLVGGG